MSYIAIYSHYHYSVESDVVTIPPAQLQRQLNVDNIQMQPSPAYVSIDNKSPRLYQNIARE